MKKEKCEDNLYNTKYASPMIVQSHMYDHFVDMLFYSTLPLLSCSTFKGDEASAIPV